MLEDGNLCLWGERFFRICFGVFSDPGADTTKRSQQTHEGRKATEKRKETISRSALTNPPNAQPTNGHPRRDQTPGIIPIIQILKPLRIIILRKPAFPRPTKPINHLPKLNIIPPPRLRNLPQPVPLTHKILHPSHQPPYLPLQPRLLLLQPRLVALESCFLALEDGFLSARFEQVVLCGDELRVVVR